MGTTTAYVARLTPYKKRFLSAKSQHRLALIATLALLLIVPLRHFLFDHSSQFTAMMLGLAGCIAIVTSLVFWDKSGWCAGLCPIHPVEKFYGISPAANFKNVQCPSCTRCVKSCPDAVKTPQHLTPEHSTFQEKLMVGGFPGFVWGWFQIEDVPYIGLWDALIASYAYPFIGMAISLCLFHVIKRKLTPEQHKTQIKVFIALTAIGYYWFIVPILLHMGELGIGARFTAANTYLPLLIIWPLRIAVSLFLFWWIVLRKPSKRNWLARPPVNEFVLKQYHPKKS
jgi:ferredoxin